MSRSYRIPILKDKPRNYKRTSAYWRPIRRVTKQIVSTYKYEDELYPVGEDYLTEKEFLNRYETNDIDLPNPKTIVDDWDYCDYFWDMRNPWHSEKDRIKYNRK